MLSRILERNTRRGRGLQWGQTQHVKLGCTPCYPFLRIDNTSKIHLTVQGLASANDGENEGLILTDLKRQTTYPVIWKAAFVDDIGLVKHHLYRQTQFEGAIDERNPICVQESVNSRNIKGMQTHNLLFITVSMSSWNRMSGLVEAMHESAA